MLLEQRMLFGFAQVVGDHFLHHLVQGDFRHPAQVFFGFAGVDLLPTSRTKVMEQSPLISENSGYETIQIYR